MPLFGPCLCGATDCPRCHPGCRDWVECDGCGRDFRRHEMTVDGFGNTVCLECLEEQKAAKEAEESENG